MQEPPPPIVNQLATMLAIAADLGFILLLWFSSAPVVIKVAATCALFLFAFAIVCFQLGRRYEWKRIHVRGRGS
jgi:hypothetical protein